MCVYFAAVVDPAFALRVGVYFFVAGTITCMEFYKSTHLLTGSEDHAVCIWRVHDWALLHVLGGHKGAVTSLRYVPFFLLTEEGGGRYISEVTWCLFRAVSLL